MEQIVKIFIHQSYFIENDLVVDYNVEQGAHVNVSPKDWIALIPKGWSGIDDQVAFKTVDTNGDVANLAIKSVVMEKKCFQNIVQCEKLYQLMYIGQYLEILGRSEYFIFLHQSSICTCVSSLKKTESKENLRPSRLSSVLSRKPLRRQSPTPREFYKNRPQSQKSDKPKSKQWSTNKCLKCNAPINFTALESAYLTKIQDLTINNEVMEQRLLKVEQDLVHTLEVINKQFKLSQAITQQRDDIQKFIDEVVDGLLNDGKITFWAHDREFSVVREFPDENLNSLPTDDCIALPINMSLNSSREAYMKAIIGKQEQTIQHLVSNIRESFNFFLKENTQSTDENGSILTSSKNKICNIGYMDSSGTTYFSPPPYIVNTLNNIDLYLPDIIKNNDSDEKKKENENVNKWVNNNTFGNELVDVLESKETTTLTKESVEKVSFDSMTCEIDGEKDGNKYEYDQLSANCSKEKSNTYVEINYDLKESDDSV